MVGGSVVGVVIFVGVTGADLGVALLVGVMLFVGETGADFESLGGAAFLACN